MPRKSFVGMLKIYLSFGFFIFRLGFWIYCFSLVTFEKFGGHFAQHSTKDGYGSSSNAFRSRSSGTRMECACRVSDPKIAETCRNHGRNHGNIMEILQGIGSAFLSMCSLMFLMCPQFLEQEKRYDMLILHNIR